MNTLIHHETRESHKKGMAAKVRKKHVIPSLRGISLPCHSITKESNRRFPALSANQSRTSEPNWKCPARSDNRSGVHNGCAIPLPLENATKFPAGKLTVRRCGDLNLQPRGARTPASQQGPAWAFTQPIERPNVASCRCAIRFARCLLDPFRARWRRL
jgi:hypothetical protein